MGPNSTNRRLDSWKEIAGFFQRDERTVKRWEHSRGLPVHRVPGGQKGRVFAYTDELSEWLKGPAAEAGPAELEPVAPVESPAAPESAAPPPARKWWTAWVAIGLATLVLVLVTISQDWFHVVRGASKRRVNPEAQNLYLEGRFHFEKRTPDELNLALDCFTRAIVKDPGYAPAYAGLADTYNLIREYGTMPEAEAYSRALAAAKKAVELDDTLPEAHCALAFASFYGYQDYKTGDREFQRAVQLNPDYKQAHHWYATSLLMRGHAHRALAQIEIAQKLDPSSAAILSDRALILGLLGRREEAISQLKEIEAAEPKLSSPHRYLSYIYLDQQDCPKYLAEWKQLAILSYDEEGLADQAAAEKGFASGGARGMLESILASQKRQYGEGKAQAYNLAGYCAMLGRSREAIEYLRESSRKREASILFLRADKSFAGMRNDPDLVKLEQELGLPEPD